MTFLETLNRAIDTNNSLICVGLDSDLDKLPDHIKSQPAPLLTFNKSIVDATASLVCCYKINSAFYEAFGETGIKQLQQTTEYIKKNYPGTPIILDAKRADIGNTNEGYVKYAFDYLRADAITLHPYLGKEALEPFLALKDKGMIILCRTSNPGVEETQDVLVDGVPYYQYLAKKIATRWNTNNNCLLVTGATYPEEMAQIRKIVGDKITFLVPGIGAQGGDVEKTINSGLNTQRKGLIIHSARGIIFASGGKDFAEVAQTEAAKLRDEVNKYRR